MNILQKKSATWDFLMIGKVNLYGGNPFTTNGNSLVSNHKAQSVL